MTYILVAGLIAATAAVITFALLSRSDRGATMAARDMLNAERKVSAEWESKYKTTAAKLVVVETSKQQEQNLRAIAETQRNIAQARVRELLRAYAKTATNEEIQELTDAAFSSPLSVVPRAPERVPSVPARSETGADRLIDPWANVQPPKPAR